MIIRPNPSSPRHCLISLILSLPIQPNLAMGANKNHAQDWLAPKTKEYNRAESDG